LKFTTLLAGGLLALLGTVCHAGAFSVTPVRLYFEPRDRAVAVTLVNEGDDELALQTDIHSWTQDSVGVDQLVLTDDLVVAPPSLRLAPHTKQVVRLTLLVPRDASRQMTYRLIVREVPEAFESKGTGIRLPIALVLNMPVFVTPAGARRRVECAWDTGPVATPSVTCENTGTAYAQVREVELKRAGAALARFEGGMYLLPGARKTLPLKLLEGASLTPGAAEMAVVFDDRNTQRFDVRLP